MVTLNTDEWQVLALAFVIGAMVGAVAVEFIVSFRLNANQTEITKLRARLANFTDPGRDQRA